MPNDNQSESRTLVQTAQTRLQAVIDGLRADIKTSNDLRLKAMLETSAEVLGGLNKAFSDFQKKNEDAWR